MDISTVELPKSAGRCFRVSVGVSSIIGTRKTQQDTTFAQATERGGIGIVCDGIGGMNSGEIASRTAAQMLAEDFFAAEILEDIPGFLRREVQKIDEAVYNLQDEQGRALEAGTTMVAAIIEGDQLYWISVGDSRIYLLRGNEIAVATREHNYRLALDQQKKNGQITQQFYDEQIGHGDALISYIGMGNVSLMDRNRTSFRMLPGDMVLLCSDGLYRSLSEEMLLQALQKCPADLELAAHRLTAYAFDVSKGAQDNTSIVLLRYDG